MAEEQARSLLRRVEGKLRPLAIDVNLAHWEASTTGTAKAQETATAAETRLRKFLSSRSRYERLVELLDSQQLHEPLVRRQLQLLALDHQPNLLPESVIDDLVRRVNQIQAEFYSFRARLDGREITNNEIIQLLRSERDPARRKAAWEASKQIAPRVAERLLELVARRNETARSLGYRDFYAMHLQLHEIDEGELLRIFAELRQRTDEPFQVAKAQIDQRLAKRHRTRADALRPWHYEDPFFQEPPLSEELGLAHHFRGRDLVAIAGRFFAGIALPLREVLDRSDLYERAGKDQHAYCVNIDREGDVRVLCNLKDDERWMGTLLHELGHAAYEKFLPGTLPWILRQPAHMAITEAIAMFMDRLTYDIDWLEASAEARPKDREELQRRAVATVRFEMLLLVRWVLVMTYFERELYGNPGRDDLDQLWWDLVEELQQVPRPENRDAPDWAAKIHLTVAPVYYHNYLLGELIASQLRASIGEEVLNGAQPRGYVERAELGTFLRDRIFTHGASRHWQDLLQDATGSRLDPEPFISEFVTASSAGQVPQY